MFSIEVSLQTIHACFAVSSRRRPIFSQTKVASVRGVKISTTSGTIGPFYNPPCSVEAEEVVVIQLRLFFASREFKTFNSKHAKRNGNTRFCDSGAKL